MEEGYLGLSSSNNPANGRDGLENAEYTEPKEHRQCSFKISNPPSDSAKPSVGQQKEAH